MRSSPAVSPDGATIYIGSSSSTVHALNAATGAEVWSFQTAYRSRSEASPAVSPDGATIYMGSNDHSVYALNAATGAEVWSFQTGGNVRSSPAVSPDGATIYIGSHDYSVYALNAATGAEVWSFQTGNWVFSSPAVSPDGATIYIGSWDNSVYALNAATGAEVWSFQTGSHLRSSPAVSPDGATIYIGSMDGVYALNSESPCPANSYATSTASTTNCTCNAGYKREPAGEEDCVLPHQLLHLMHMPRSYRVAHAQRRVRRRCADRGLSGARGRHLPAICQKRSQCSPAARLATGLRGCLLLGAELQRGRGPGE